jgi:DNA-nicking Smr family endonuclease
MKRQPRPDEVRLWAIVAATVRPGPGRKPVTPPPGVAQELETRATGAPKPFAVEAHKTRSRPTSSPAPGDIEPGRKRRLTRERDPIELRLDLHGLDQHKARVALIGFLIRAREDGVRAVLVITGKGLQGDGVLRRMTPEWLADRALRGVVSGVSEAHRRHGGEGAFYVALKRRGG